MNTEGLSDRQIMEQVRLIYVRLKSKDRSYSMVKLAKETGLKRSSFYAAMVYKVASQKTIAILRNYLENSDS